MTSETSRLGAIEWNLYRLCCPSACDIFLTSIPCDQIPIWKAGSLHQC